MSEERARAVCADLAATHEDRETHRWIPRPTQGGWEVVKVNIAPPLEGLHAEQRAEPRPSSADDPRSSHDQRVGGPYGGA
jgi:hypothetical protein